jgi:hypothetical protein
MEVRVTIERLGGGDAEVVVEPLLRGYLPWVAEQLAELGVTFGDTDAGRALLERLLGDARDEGYEVARLETLVFVTTAQALYRSMGFRDVEIFDGSEAAVAGLESLTQYLELDLS